MIDNVVKTIEDNSMISLGDKIIVGVSGGPDSMCLLHVLHVLRDRYKIRLVVAHVNHCLRGEESDRDEDYVKEFCKFKSIEFYAIRVDINKMCQEKNISCETAGREARYSFFNKVLKETKGNKIALAHNANDQCETILMRIMRGTGMQGLIGIKPVRDNLYIRPLINSNREDIEEYCDEFNINPRIDKTNLETIYTRNKIRLELIPYMKNNFNSDLVNSVNRLSTNIAIDNEFMEKISMDTFNKYSIISKDKVIIRKEVFDKHMAIVSRILRLAIHYINGNLYNCEKIHIDSIIKLQNNTTGKFIRLPNSIVAINNYGDIVINKKGKIEYKKNNEEYVINLGENKLDNNIKVCATLINGQESINFDEAVNTKYFDFNKINGNILLRYRKDGDRFTSLGMKGSKKVKDIFMDLKIPKNERDNIPLICFHNEIAWIVGYRVSEKFKVEKSTKEILKISVESEEIR
ncbi:tRNA lysidine(34) synthetase TilS [Clostridium rectalis]|uniref:tRNA lysidine(34) synthetase TilS n=1 Tax=Clostridium rectalis TaxID=2040295 RepID=UPI000F639272|nr:tRNA lysidine(34) synthetase TilS [Clostridium rectalis]